MMLVILAGAIVLLFALIMGLKLNSFLSLIIVCLTVGLAEGLPLLKIVSSIEAGMGGTLGHLSLIIGFGAMLGKLMADSGGAQRIAMTLIDSFGRKNISWAVTITGFVVGIAMFFEVSFVLLIPLVFTVAASARIPLLEVGIPMMTSIAVAHCFLPPHPGPTAIAVLYNADIGKTLLYGLAVAIPVTVVTGPLFYKLVQKMGLNPEIPKHLHDPKLFTEEEMPSFVLSMFTALIPVVLMALASIAKMNMEQGTSLYTFVEFIGNPDMALLIAVFVAFFTFGYHRGKNMKELMKSVEQSVSSIAMILLIVGGGGAFKQVLLDGGMGNYIVSLASGMSVSPLILAWCIAALVRVAVGSATVAALTTGGIVAPIIATTGANPELLVLVTSCGSMFAGPPNDVAFWMFKEYFNLSIKETLLTWCPMATLMSVLGLVGTLILNSIFF